jgi:hypothetical protein
MIGCILTYTRVLLKGQHKAKKQYAQHFKIKKTGSISEELCGENSIISYKEC